MLMLLTRVHISLLFVFRISIRSAFLRLFQLLLFSPLSLIAKNRIIKISAASFFSSERNLNKHLAIELQNTSQLCIFLIGLCQCKKVLKTEVA